MNEAARRYHDAENRRARWALLGKLAAVLALMVTLGFVAPLLASLPR